MDEIRVGDIQCVLARRESDRIRAAQPIRHHADIPRRRVEAVDLLGQLGAGAEAALVAVDGVGEPDAAVGVDGGVGGGVEGARVVVVEDGVGFVGAFRFHVDEG